MSHSHSHSHGHDEVGHVVSEKTFAKILVALLVLTVITVAAAQVDLGKWNIVVFMHGMYENKILWVYILIPFILLAIMIGGIFTDDPFRDRPLPFGAEQAKVAAPQAPKSAHH